MPSRQCFLATSLNLGSNPPDDFSLDLYAYYHAQSAGLNVYRFPVRFGERAHGSSHWNYQLGGKAKVHP